MLEVFFLTYVVAEWISDNAYYRKWIRSFLYKNASLTSKKKKNSVDENATYTIYYDFKEPLKGLKPHRILAINRGEKEGILSAKLDYSEEEITKFLEKKIIKRESFVNDLVKAAIKDSLKRLILPSVEREIRADKKKRSLE